MTFASAYQFHVYYSYRFGLGSFAALLIEALLIVAAGAGWDVHQRVRVLELGGHGGPTPRAGLLQQGQAGRVPLTLSASMVLFSIQDHIKSRLSIVGTDFLLITPVSNPCYYCKVIFNAMLNTVSYSLLLLIKRIDWDRKNYGI